MSFETGFIHVVDDTTDGEHVLLQLGLRTRTPRLSLGTIGPLKAILPELAALEADAEIDIPFNGRIVHV